MSNELPPIFIISLERATERRTLVRDAFLGSGLDYEVVSAVDGTRLTSSDTAEYSSWRAMYEYGQELGRGVLGCSLSHVRVLERIVREGIPEAVVFEDDTRPGEDFRDVLRARDALPAEWDVLTFHSLYAWASPSLVDREPIAHGYRVCRYERTPMGTQAYMITQRAAQRVLEVAYPIALPSDELLFRRRPAGLKVFGIEPSPVLQENFRSEVRAPSPPLETHGLAARTALESIRFAGRVRRRIDEWRVRAPESAGLRSR